MIRRDAADDVVLFISGYHGVDGVLSGGGGRRFRFLPCFLYDGYSHGASGAVCGVGVVCVTCCGAVGAFVCRMGACFAYTVGAVGAVVEVGGVGSSTDGACWALGRSAYCVVVAEQQTAAALVSGSG